MNEINLENLKVAIVFEELTQLGGAERLLDIWLEIFPDAPVFTLVWDREKTKHKYDKFDIKTSFIQKLPLGSKKYKWYLPFMPKAVESFDLEDYDIILSMTSALVKGVKTHPGQIHICYCNTPTRYLWIDERDYIKNAPIPFFIRPLMPIVLKYLKKWDLKASKRPDYIISNSKNVQKRVKKYYKRDSDIIYPMIDTKKYHISAKVGDYYLLVSRIEPYKKVDLVIDAFKSSDEKLKIIGSGTKKEKLQKLAGKNIEFLGRVSDEKLAEYYAKAKAVIFPQDEDFGLIPIEAAASGRPTIAYKAGGALETIIAGKTGEFFYPQNAESLRKVIKKFNWKKYHPPFLQNHAKKFDQELFKREILEYIVDKIKVSKIKSL